MLALLAVLLAAPPTGPSTGDPTCKSDVLKIVDDALSKMRPDRHHAFALRGVAESCALPAGLAEGARDMERAPPDRRALIEARAVTMALPQWMAACPGGISTLQRMAEVAPATRKLMIWKACEVARFGVPLKALGKGSISPLGLSLAHLVRTFDPKASPRLIKALLAAQPTP